MLEALAGLLLEDRCLGCVTQYPSLDGRIVLQLRKYFISGTTLILYLLLLLLCKVALSLARAIFLSIFFGVFLLGLCEFFLGLANVGIERSIFVDIEEFDDGFFLVALL